MAAAKKLKRPERYAMLPRDVMKSDAMKKIGDTGFKVVAALTGQFYGINNGGLELTTKIAAEYGITDQRRKLFLKAAVLVGLIEVTVPGTKIGRGKGRPNKYALTFQPINEFPAYEIKEMKKPSHKWMAYVLEGEVLNSIPSVQRFLGYKTDKNSFKRLLSSQILEGQRSDYSKNPCTKDKRLPRNSMIEDKHLSQRNVITYPDKKTA